MSSTVVLILDGEYGDRLEPQPDTAIWLLGSATNVDALERLRRTAPGIDVTTFRDRPGSVAKDFAALLPDIELHHGARSQEPPFARLVVYGARPNQTVLHALAAHGFALDAPTSDGFVASRVPAA
jgi:hypothetical protein